MHLLVPMLIGALASAMASLVGRLILALGVSFITYKGIGAGVDVMKNYVVSSFDGMPSQMVSLVAYLWIDKGLTIIFSAFTAALSLKLAGGSIKKAVLK